jgi:TatD DNase family protein
MRLIKEMHKPLKGVMHCASGPPEFIRESLAMGFFISFAGNITFPKAGDLRQLLEIVPDDRLLIETDAPFLAPQAMRGKTNEPSYLVHTGRAIADLRRISFESLCHITSRNASGLFGFPSGD